MQIQTILNRLHPFKSFCYQSARFREGKIEVVLRARANGRPVCSGCGRRRPGYDTRKTRRYAFIPLWNVPVIFCYGPRRVNCPDCGNQDRAGAVGGG